MTNLLSPTLVYLVDAPLRESKKQSLGIDDLQAQHANLYFIDVAEIFYKGNRKKFNDHYLFDSSMETLSVHYSQNANNCIDQITQLNLPDNSKIIIHFTLSSLKGILLFFKLKRSFPDYEFIIFYPFSIPRNHFYWTSFSHIKKSLKIPLKEFLMICLSYFMPKAEHIFLPCRNAICDFTAFVGNSTKISYIENIDITQLKLKKNVENIIKDKYLLYLDSSITDSIDNQVLNIDTKISKENYYDALERFLKLAASVLQMNVVIAAHPSSSFFNRSEGQFRGFKYFKNNTPALSVHAAAFIADFPTNSVTYPISLNRPLILFKSNKLLINYRKDWHFRGFKALEKNLLKNFINIDQDRDKIKCELLNELKNLEGYNAYRKNFLEGPHGKSEQFIQAILKTL
jgi:hypothetical protein